MSSQSKNITKTVLTVLILTLVGEGGFGLGIFWPFLLILLETRLVFWLAMIVGILISVIYRVPVGLPSLFLVVVTGGLSITLNSRKESSLLILFVAVLANLVFDKAFGLSWTFWELLAVIGAWFIAVTWFEKGESIRINY